MTSRGEKYFRYKGSRCQGSEGLACSRNRNTAGEAGVQERRRKREGQKSGLVRIYGSVTEGMCLRRLSKDVKLGNVTALFIFQ